MHGAEQQDDERDQRLLGGAGVGDAFNSKKLSSD